MITKHTIKPLALAIILTGLGACEAEIEREFPAEAHGDADFSVYVALGNSLTAGFSDGFLNRSGQVNSYPAILADKMAAVTEDFTFVQPLMPEGVVEGTLQLAIGADGKIGIAPSQGGISRLEAATPVRGVFQNLGIPGAKVADLTRAEMQSPTANFFYNRFAQPGQTPLQLAMAQNPTFFTLWIGANDVLEFATTGGEDDPSTPYQEKITGAAEFRASYEAIISGLKQSNAGIEGALGNVPSIAAIPYFNVVPWNAFALTSQEQVDAITAGVANRIEPAVRTAVDSVARTRVIRGVIETGARRQIIRGVIEEGARRQIIAQVAPAVVYQQAYDAAIAQGATPEQASAAAQQYVQSAEGQATIAALRTNLIENREPAQVHDIVEQQLASDNVQGQINQTTAAAIAADEDGNPDTTLTGVIGAEGAATVEAIYASNTTQNQINQTYDAALVADENDALDTVLGPVGAATVDAVYSSPRIVAQREAGFQEQIGGLKQAGFYPTFVLGANGFVVASEQSPTGIKQLTAAEKMLLTFQSRTLAEFNPAAGQIVVPDKYALDVFELQEINSAIDEFNSIIADIAVENTFALVDINAYFNQLIASGGLTIDGVRYNADYADISDVDAGQSVGDGVTIFSLDGIHSNPRGYAIVAREFTERINAYYNASLPEVRVSAYPLIPLPAPTN